MDFSFLEPRPGLAAVAGEMTIYTAAALRDGLQALGPGPVDIDLAGVTDVDVAGLQWMLMAKRQEDWPVRFINHSDAVLQMLDLSNLAGTLGDPLVLTRDPAGS